MAWVHGSSLTSLFTREPASRKPGGAHAISRSFSLHTNTPVTREKNRQAVGILKARKDERVNRLDIISIQCQEEIRYRSYVRNPLGIAWYVLA